MVAARTPIKRLNWTRSYQSRRERSEIACVRSVSLLVAVNTNAIRGPLGAACVAEEGGGSRVLPLPSLGLTTPEKLHPAWGQPKIFSNLKECHLIF